MSKADLRLDFVSHKAAKYAVEHWHYSRRMPKGNPQIFIGVWEAGRFIGSVIFGGGANISIGRPFGLHRREIAELTRVALAVHCAPVSRIVAIALRLLMRANPGLKAVLSYADQKEGHHGGIYQALGWTYTGTGGSSTQFYYKGKWLHSRVVTGLAFGRQRNSMERLRDKLWQSNRLPVRKVPGKHRYILALDPALRPRVKALAKPYPKRKQTPASESSTCHPHGGGRGSTDPDAPNAQA